jgi:hypothetical protein
MKRLILAGMAALALGLAAPAQAQTGPDCNAKPTTVIDVWLCAMAGNSQPSHQLVPGEYVPGTNPLQVMAP